MKVLDYAQQMEEFGKNYLSSLAEGASYPGVRTVLKMLADEQQEVVEKVAQMRERNFNLESSGLDYVDRQFTNIFEERPMKSDLEAYSYGVMIEERMTSLFQQAAQAEPDSEAREVLLRLAEEQRKHWEAWQELYDHVTVPARTVACAEFITKQ